jgi:hypothetical protein
MLYRLPNKVRSGSALLTSPPFAHPPKKAPPFLPILGLSKIMTAEPVSQPFFKVIGHATFSALRVLRRMLLRHSKLWVFSYFPNKPGFNQAQGSTLGSLQFLLQPIFTTRTSLSIKIRPSCEPRPCAWLHFHKIYPKSGYYYIVFTVEK